jgi:aminoglycoside/choline kinase family phosphotransferase
MEFPLTDAQRWLHDEGFDPSSFQLMSGDVSARRYARLRFAAGRSHVLCFYPPDMRGVLHRFADSTRLLQQSGVPVPAIVAQSPERGLVLLEDLGEVTLFDVAGRSWEQLLPYIVSAARLIPRIQALAADRVASLNPPLDASLLGRELRQTWELFLSPRQLTGDRVLSLALEGALSQLCRRLAAEEAVPCHRDFMARNLVPLPGPSDEPTPQQVGVFDHRVGVLDHQDLRLGPPLYDLASLLNDSLFPPDWIAERLFEQLGLPVPSRLGYHRAAAQRTLKAVGTYAACLRRGSDRHLPLIAPTLARALLHLKRLPEFATLSPRLEVGWRDVVGGAAIC